MEAFLYFGVGIFKICVTFKGKTAIIGTFRRTVRKETRVLSLERMLDGIKQVY